jgi:hypothetical protein
MTTATEILARLKAVAPKWFGYADTPIIDAVLSGAAVGAADITGQLDDVHLQTRIRTATGANLDMIAADFFGRRIRRNRNETDGSFRRRILAEIFRERATLAGMKKALLDLTTFDARIWEPAKPANGGGYSTGRGGYNYAGAYASLQYPSQAFITVYRPLNVTSVPGINGYSGVIGGYGVGRSQYARIEDSIGAIEDATIHDTVVNVAPAGVRCWVNILSSAALRNIELPCNWASRLDSLITIQTTRSFAAGWTAGGSASLTMLVGNLFAVSWSAGTDVYVNIGAGNLPQGDWSAIGNVSASVQTSWSPAVAWGAQGNATAGLDVERLLSAAWTPQGNASATLASSLDMANAWTLAGNTTVNVSFERLVINGWAASGNATGNIQVTRNLASAMTAGGNATAVIPDFIGSDWAVGGDTSIAMTYGTATIITSGATTTWTVPAGATGLQVEALGAGSDGISSAYAGGGAAYARSNNIPVTPGSTVYLSIGQTPIAAMPGYAGQMGGGGGGGGAGNQSAGGVGSSDATFDSSHGCGSGGGGGGGSGYGGGGGNGGTGGGYGGGGGGRGGNTSTGSGTAGAGTAGLIVATYSGAQHFYASGAGNFVVPAGVTAIQFECLGGGGNGSTGSSAINGGAGGGGGAYSITNSVTVVPGGTVYYSVGGAGTQSWARYATNGAPTGTSDGCLAKGGSPASNYTGGAGGLASTSIGDTKYDGGAGGAGTNSSGGVGGAGGGGGSAGPSGVGQAGGAGTFGLTASHYNAGGGGGGGANGGSSTAGAASTTGSTNGGRGGVGGAGNSGVGGGFGGWVGGHSTWVNVNRNNWPTAASEGCLADGGIGYNPASSGGLAAKCIGDVAYSGGGGAAYSGSGYGGGGGAGGPSGTGKDGATGHTTYGGGGGGGANGGSSTAGSVAVSGAGGAGGAGTAGTGAGSGGTSAAHAGGTGSSGGGGGGAYPSGAGGAGGSDTAFDATHGCGAGGGGGSSGNGGAGGAYGGGGGAGTTAGVGGNGIVVLTSLKTITN